MIRMLIFFLKTFRVLLTILFCSKLLKPLPKKTDDVCAGSSDGEQILSDDNADVLTVSSSVSGTPQSAAVATPPRVGVPGSLEPSQLISSLEAFS